MPQSVCLTTALALILSSSLDRHVERDRHVVPTSVSSPCTVETVAVGRRLDRCRAELDRPPLQDVVVDRLLDARLVVVAERLHAAGALADPQRSGVGVSSMLDRRVVGPTSSVACQAVTWIRRLCPALAAAPVRSVLTESVPLPGPNVCVPGRIAMRGAYSRAPSRL